MKLENRIYSVTCSALMEKIPDGHIDCIIANTPNIKKYDKAIRQSFFDKLSNKGILIVVVPNTSNGLFKTTESFALPLLFEKTGFKLVDTIVFNNNVQPSPYSLSACIRSGNFCDQYKIILILAKEKPKTFNLIRKTNVWTYDEEDIEPHLPDQISEDLILAWTPKDSLIYIPFEDNGYIAKAAKANDRKWLMSEIPKSVKATIEERINSGSFSFNLVKSDQVKRARINKESNECSFFINKRNDVFITSREYEELSDEEKKQALKKVFFYYRKKGFPYPEFTPLQISQEMHKLKHLDTKTLIGPDNIIKRNKMGLLIANHYMPHMYEVRSHNFYTPMESFMDTKLLLRAIKKSIDFNGGIRDSTLRSALKWVTGTQMVSNFRPTVAKYIYDTYGGTGRVLDFSCGYGGRLIGAMSSKRVTVYEGTDPCVPTYKGLLRIKRDFGEGKKIKIQNLPFEDAKFKRGYFDLAFSSPPYFHQEEYGDEEGQSFNRYPTKEKWRDGFLKPLIKNCYGYIKDDGYFILNIANIETYKTFEEDALKIAKKVGFTLVKTYLMSLSRLFTSTAFKFEPVYVFQKSKYVRKKHGL